MPFPETDVRKRGQLPGRWLTNRVEVTDATAGDVARLTEVFNACNHIEAWDPTFHQVETLEIGKLVKRSQAKDDDYLGFRLQALRLRDSGELCGYFHLYHGKPQPDVCWISIFVIHPDHQGQHIAREVVARMAVLLREAGYRALWLEVFLRNWPAMRFWIKQGFTTILAYEGDKAMTDNQSQARLLLERPLTAELNNR